MPQSLTFDCKNNSVSNEWANMEIKFYLQILLRWVRLLLLCLILGSVVGYTASRLEKPTYQASTKILISKDLSDQSSQFAAMNIQQIIDTNVQLLISKRVTDEASQRLNFKINLKETGSVQQIRSTNVIEILIDDSNPQQAAEIANMLVKVLIDQNTQANARASTEENLTKNITQIEDQISILQNQINQISDEKLQSQLKQVNDQIATLQEEILKLTIEIGSLSSSNSANPEQNSQFIEKQTQVAQLQSQLTQYQQIRINLEYAEKPILNSSTTDGDLQLQLLQASLDRYQKNYLGLLDNLQAVQLAQIRSNPMIDQIEVATPPTKPIHPRPVIYTILGGIIGLMLAIGIIFIYEQFIPNFLEREQENHEQYTNIS